MIKSTIQIILTLSIYILTYYTTYAQASNWTSKGIGGGGALFFPSINPANDNEFYIACDMGEYFHSSNFGLSYQPLPFYKVQAGNLSRYQFTNNPNIAYCLGTNGNNTFLLKTTNAGQNWDKVTTTPYPDDNAYNLAVDYQNPDRLLIVYYNEMYFSGNGGQTFTLIKTANNTSNGLYMAGAFFDGNTIIVATNDGLLQSTNAGQNFTALTTSGLAVGESIFSFAGAKNGSISRFFCLTAPTANIYNGIQPSEYYNFTQNVYSMELDSNIWTAKNTGISSTDHLMYVGMAQNNIDIVYLAGNDETTAGPNVMKTTNAGASWVHTFNSIGNVNISTGWSGQGGDRGWGYGESCFGIAVAPSNADKVIFGDFGFVHTTTNGGNSWKQAYVSPTDENPAGSNTPTRKYYSSIGIENTTCWQVFWNDANNMFACFSDIRGMRSNDAGQKWAFDYTGHTANTMYRIVKQPVSNILFAGTSGIHDMYQSTRLADNPLDNNDTAGKIIYSTDGGGTWQNMRVFNHPVFWLALDPNNNNRMYASVIHYGAGTGVGGIYRSDNINNLAAATWTKLPNPPRTQGHPASIVVLNDGNVLATYSGRRTASGFTNSSGVFLYNTANGTWTDLSATGMLYWTKDIILDPADTAQNTWYVCVFSGWGGAPNGLGGLYKTTDRGQNWQKLTGAQFDRVGSITFNPNNTQQAYLTTEGQGLWYSNNMHTTNSSQAKITAPDFTFVADYPFSQPERVFFNPYNNNEVWVSSFGHGMKVGTTAAALPLSLLSFTAKNTKKNQVTLQWEIANNSNQQTVFLQKSDNGNTFKNIGTFTAQNSDNERIIQQHTDTLVSQIQYYRLAIADLTGNKTYSNSLAVNRPDWQLNLAASPNPATNNIAITWNSQNTSPTNIQIINSTGVIVLEQLSNSKKGNNSLTLTNLGKLPKGIYNLKIWNNGQSQTLKVVK
jgi:photosystem II stability/assembly factor-like uncharacterized protein